MYISRTRFFSKAADRFKERIERYRATMEVSPSLPLFPPSPLFPVSL